MIADLRLRAAWRKRALRRGRVPSLEVYLQNLFFALAHDSVGVPVATGILYPFSGLLLDPMIAAAAMSTSSVSAIGNALWLRAAGLCEKPRSSRANAMEWHGDRGKPERGGTGRRDEHPDSASRRGSDAALVCRAGGPDHNEVVALRALLEEGASHAERKRR